LVLAAAASLSPAVFVQLSEKDNGGTEQTSEGRMLEASRAEIQKKVDDDVQGFRRVRQSVLLFLDLYVWEPMCTGLRFLHLVVIFVPVMVAVPAIWFGRRQKGRDGERSGTLWWYGFLVRGMERAGPAFIKVCVFLFWGGKGENGEKGGRYDGAWRASGRVSCFHEKAKDGLNSSGPRKATGTSPGK
jgi:aarF domain-containing kinase